LDFAKPLGLEKALPPEETPPVISNSFLCTRKRAT
jgi:hypothetical protein